MESISKFKKNLGSRGITLIALVITIIVLLILAGVSIATLTGENSILAKANVAKERTIHETVKEAILLKYTEYIQELSINNKQQKQKPTSRMAVVEPISIKSFVEFLQEEKYVDEKLVINIERLVGNKLSLGNGTGTTDVYKIEQLEENEKWILKLKYMDEKAVEKILWEETLDVKSIIEGGDGDRDTDIAP